MPTPRKTLLEPLSVGGKTLGQRLREARETVGMTQAEVATGMGMDAVAGRVQVNQWEQDRRGVSADMLFRLSITLDTNPNQLLGWNDRNTPTSKA